MHLPTITIIPILLHISLVVAAPLIESLSIYPQFRSCADTDSTVPICAEIYNTTDCTGPSTVATASARHCHNVRAISRGSIHVRKGSVFTGFFYDDCKQRPEIFTGPLWREGDQGCQVVDTKKIVKSWDAW